MPSFTFSVLEPNGHKRKGTLQAESARAARAQLQRSGARIISIASARNRKWFTLELDRSVSAHVASEFATELASLLEAGAPLRQALEIQASGRTRVATLASAVKRGVVSGETLSSSLRANKGHAGLLAEFVHAGEAGGRFEPMLRQAGFFLRSREDASKKVRSALAYPLFILVLAILAIFVITVYVAPALAPTLEETNPSSFILTLSQIGDFLSAHMRTIALITAFTISVGFLALRTQRAHQVITLIAWNLPVLGGILKDLSAGQSGTVLAALLRAGRSFESALKFAANVADPILAKEYTLIAQKLRDGRPLAAAINEAKYLPYEIKRLAILGEQSSALPQAIFQASELCAARAMRRIDQLSSMLGPALVIGLGVGISLLLISVLGSLSSIGDVGL